MSTQSDTPKEPLARRQSTRQRVVNPSVVSALRELQNDYIADEVGSMASTAS